MVLSHKERSSADAEFAVAEFSADAEKFDGPVNTARIAEIYCCHAGDPFTGDIFIAHSLRADQGRKDRDLAARVVTFHIRGGISLRIAFLLRLSECSLKRQT